jgi:hypothetical protein
MTLTIITATSVLAATNYSNMNNEELDNLRGTMHAASREERNAFRSEWQQRMKNMTPEERQKYGARHNGASGKHGTCPGRSNGHHGMGGRPQ